jgi:peptidoglycan-associated lipoprotein
MRYCIILLIIVYSCASLHKSALDDEIQIDRVYKTGEYKQASVEYEIIFNKYDQIKDPNEKQLATESKARVAYKIARNSERSGNFEKAEKWYAKAEELNYQEKKPKLFYHIAELNKQKGDIEKAIDYYKRYQVIDPKGELLAKVGIESCEQAEDWGETENKKFEISKISEISDSASNDYAPQIANEQGTLLYFTSNREGANSDEENSVYGKYYTDIFSAKKLTEDSWDTPKPLKNPFINSEYSDGAISLSPDFQTLFYTHCRKVYKDESPCVIKFAKKVNDSTWGVPEVLQIPKFRGASIGQPAMNKEKNRIYFASDYQDSTSFGGKDIWYVDVLDSVIGEPVNMGPIVNTSGDEMYPYVREDGKIFFSSNGHMGIGGLDIFQYIKTDSTDGKVENLKPPINSTADDFGISYALMEDENTYKGYFSSDRERKGIDNIWHFTEFVSDKFLKVVVKDADTKEIIDGAEVVLKNENGDESVEYTTLDEEVKFPVIAQRRYEVEILKDNYLPYDFSIETEELTEDLLANSKEISLIPMNKENDFRKVSDDITDVVDSLYNILIKHPDIKAVVESHEDYLGTDIENYNITQKRAESVVDLLLKRGIDSTRLIAVGYGEEAPLYIDDDLFDKHKFIPDNYLNSSMDSSMIVTLTQDDQDKANLLNKRLSYTLVDDMSLASYKGDKQRIDDLLADLSKKSVEEDLALNTDSLNLAQKNDVSELESPDLEKKSAEVELTESSDQDVLKDVEIDDELASQINNLDKESTLAVQNKTDGELEEDSETDVDESKIVKDEEAMATEWWKHNGDRDQVKNRSKFSYDNFRKLVTNLLEQDKNRNTSGEILIQIGSFRDYKLSAKLRARIKSVGMTTSQERFRVFGKTWYRVYIIHKTGAKQIQDTYNKLIQIGVTETPIIRLINW